MNVEAESNRECRHCIEYARAMWINVVIDVSGIEPRSECYIEGRHCCIVVPKISSKLNIVSRIIIMYQLFNVSDTQIVK